MEKSLCGLCAKMGEMNVHARIICSWNNMWEFIVISGSTKFWNFHIAKSLKKTIVL